MKILRLQDDSLTHEIAAEAAQILERGGLVCLPCSGKYRILASLRDEDAVMRMMAVKGRMKAAPALVFIAHADDLGSVADGLEPDAMSFARRFWPGPLTLRMLPGRAFSTRVVKQLGGKKTRVGVRIPRDPLVVQTIEAFGGPVLVTSANRERKSGETSPAQVMRTFGQRVDLFVDQGDLQEEPKSSVVEFEDGQPTIARPGVLDEAIQQWSAKAHKTELAF